MEEVIAKFTEKTSAAKHPDLRQLDSLSYQKQQQSVKPSVTFYARVMGQEISFIHLDQSTIFDLIRNGKLEVKQLVLLNNVAIKFHSLHVAATK